MNHQDIKAPRQISRLDEKGFTLIELMVSVVILALVTPALLLLLNKTRQSFSAEEMHMQLRAINEQTVNRMHLFLASDKHIYEGNAAGVSFLARVQFAAGTPAVLAGSKLPIVMSSVSGSLSPNSTGFLPADIGNSLFFLAYDSPQTYVQPGGGTPQITSAPATLMGANSSSVTQTVIIDLYRFYYYYLSSTNPQTSSGFPAYNIVEWQSIQYADYQQVNGIGDDVLMGNVSQGLLSLGVSFAVDPTATAPASLFYDIQTGGAYPSSDPNRNVTQYRYTYLTHTPFGTNGVLSSGYFYGISPNSALWTQWGAPVTVPQYATASSPFPGGLEIGLAGTAAGRQILLRSVLVAKGSAPRIEVDDMNTVVEAKDE